MCVSTLGPLVNMNKKRLNMAKKSGLSHLKCWFPHGSPWIFPSFLVCSPAGTAKAHVHHDSPRGRPLDGRQDAPEAGHGRGSAAPIWPETVTICSIYIDILYTYRYYIIDTMLLWCFRKHGSAVSLFLNWRTVVWNIQRFAIPTNMSPCILKPGVWKSDWWV